MSRDAWRRLRPSRTSLTFITAGSVFAFGYWLLAFAFFKSDDFNRPLAFDPTAILPGLSALFCMIIINGFTTRRVLLQDEQSYFDSGSSRGAKFLVYLCICLSLAAIGAAILLSALVYVPSGRSDLAGATVIQTTCTFASSTIIFFGREVETLPF